MVLEGFVLYARTVLVLYHFFKKGRINRFNLFYVISNMVFLFSIRSSVQEWRILTCSLIFRTRSFVYRKHWLFCYYFNKFQTRLHGLGVSSMSRTLGQIGGILGFRNLCPIAWDYVVVLGCDACE